MKTLMVITGKLIQVMTGKRHEAIFMKAATATLESIPQMH